VVVFQAVEAGRALWPQSPASAVPDTCSSAEADWSEAPPP
jgi:hypothetical protein